jgi:ribosomal protein S18 acetylase RimI-like enzyme
MLTASIVTTKEELEQVHILNQQNLKQHLSPGERMETGFVTWLYPLSLLEEMHRLAPGILVKDGELVAGYALTTLKEASAFHPDLQVMFSHVDNLEYRGRPLHAYNFYCMGQICVHKDYRRKGIVQMLYEKHREVYGNRFDFILTEVSTSNLPSLRAHEKTGFETIHTYRDSMDEWNVVVWNWT